MLKKFDDANGDKGKIMAAMDELQPLITAANIGIYITLKFGFRSFSD